MIGATVAAIMAGSFFLPWISFFGNELGPMVLLDPPNGVEMQQDWRGYAFLASFVIAALAAVLALMQRAAGVLMLVAGVIPFGIILEGALNAKQQLDDLGLPIPRGDNPMETFNRVREFIDLGLPAYFISAALLVVIGLARLVRGR